MLIRIVKMSFKADETSVFLNNFNLNKEHIRSFNGCQRLQLLQDIHQENVYFTYSYWESEKHLNAYRDSELFAQVWAKTKVLFNAKPEAWSVESKEVLN